MISKLLKVNIILFLGMGMGLFYNILLFNNVEIEMYGQYTMMLVYINFIGCVAFSPFSEVMQVFYREHLDIRYVQLCVVISLFYFGLYLLLGSLLILTFYGDMGYYAYLLPLTFALGPISSLINAFLVVEDHLNAVYVLDFFSATIKVAIISQIPNISINHIFIIAFLGSATNLLGSFYFVLFRLKMKLICLNTIHLRRIRNELWHYVRPLFYVRIISPLYKNSDRVIYSLFLNDGQLGMLNFTISVFANLKQLYKSWFSLRLPHLYKDAFKYNSVFLMFREIRETYILLLIIILIYVIYIFLYQFGFFHFDQQKWSTLFNYARFLIIPVIIQIFFGMSGDIIKAKKETKALAKLSIINIIIFLITAYSLSYLFNYNGAFSASLIIRESLSSISTFCLLLYLYLKSNKEQNNLNTL